MNILVIFTGGTIGSSVTDGWISPDKQTKKLLIENYLSKHNNDIQFSYKEPYSILSENLDSSHLNRLIKEIREESKKDYDGIIVTHGTDTLQFSASALSYALGNNSIPVILVSSNYPLNDENSNGNINFEAAVEFIKQGCGKGVFASYCNNDKHTYIHSGNSMLSHLETSDSIYSINNNYYAEYSNGEFILNKSFVDYRPVSANSTELINNPNILVISSHPADSFDYNLSGVNAIIIKPYHSGTLNTSSNKFVKFCKTASTYNIPVYVSSILPGVEYKSSKIFEDLNLIINPNTTFTDLYIKLWFDLSN